MRGACFSIVTSGVGEGGGGVWVGVSSGGSGSPFMMRSNSSADSVSFSSKTFDDAIHHGAIGVEQFHRLLVAAVPQSSATSASILAATSSE